jgi:hypothetical protein
MDKFWQIASTFVWQKEDESIFVFNNAIGYISGFNSGGYEPSTSEEFAAAALQVIEKLKAQGIDIGTDWLPKWEPKPGEVVCAWDNRNGEGGFIVAKFVTKANGVFPFELGNGHGYQHIAPFTGEIPEPFKSRWEAESNANQ